MKIMTLVWTFIIATGLTIFGQGLGYFFGQSKEPRVDYLYLIVGAQVALLAAYFSQKK